MDPFLLHGTVIICLSLKHALGNTTSAASTSSQAENAGVKTVITMVALVVIFGLSAAIAKCVNVCCVRRSTDAADDSSITDNIRELIQTRLSVMRHTKEAAQKRGFQTSLTFFRRWTERVKSRRLKAEKFANHNIADVSLHTKTSPHYANKNGVIPVEGVVKDVPETGRWKSNISRFFSGRIKASGINGVTQTSEPRSGVVRQCRGPFLNKSRVVPEVIIVVTEADPCDIQTDGNSTCNSVPNGTVNTVRRTSLTATVELHNEGANNSQT